MKRIYRRLAVLLILLLSMLFYDLSPAYAADLNAIGDLTEEIAAESSTKRLLGDEREGAASTNNIYNDKDTNIPTCTLNTQMSGISTATDIDGTTWFTLTLDKSYMLKLTHSHDMFVFEQGGDEAIWGAWGLNKTEYGCLLKGTYYIKLYRCREGEAYSFIFETVNEGEYYQSCEEVYNDLSTRNDEKSSASEYVFYEEGDSTTIHGLEGYNNNVDWYHFQLLAPYKIKLEAECYDYQSKTQDMSYSLIPNVTVFDGSEQLFSTNPCSNKLSPSLMGNDYYVRVDKNSDHMNSHFTPYKMIFAPADKSITYDANGGTGSVPEDSENYISGETIKLKSAYHLYRDGYTFKGWSTTPDGKGSLYQPNEEFTIGESSVTFYAIWSGKYNIFYKANGAPGETPEDNNQYVSGQKAKIKNTTVLNFFGHTFLGWSDDKDATTAKYQPGEEVTVDDNLVLYAIYDNRQSVANVEIDKEFLVDNTYNESYFELSVKEDTIVDVRMSCNILPTYNSKTDDLNLDLGFYDSDGNRIAEQRGSKITNDTLVFKNVSLSEGVYRIGVKQNDSYSSIPAGCELLVISNPAAVKQYSYSFDNFGRAASLELCQFMFGDNRKAKKVYNGGDGEGKGGNCFGMIVSSGMFTIAGNGVSTTDFYNSTKINDLGHSYQHSTWVYSKNGKDALPVNINVDEFIQALLISQDSPLRNKIQHNINNPKALFDLVALETTEGKPVKVGIRGDWGSQKNLGHALLAYGVKDISPKYKKILVYDPNQNNVENSIILTNKTGNNSDWEWSYRHKTIKNLTWGSDLPNGSLNYIVYDDYLSLWNNRGNLADKKIESISTNLDNFCIYSKDEDLLAKVVNGDFETVADGIWKTEYEGLLSNTDISEKEIEINLPNGEYIIENTDFVSTNEMRIDFVNVELAGSIKTTSPKIAFWVADDDDITQVRFIEATDDRYEISLESSRENEPSVTIKGLAAEAGGLAKMENGEPSTEGLTIEKTDITFTVTFDSQGGSAINSVENIVSGTAITLPSPTRDGYGFGGWFTEPNGQGTQYTDRTPITQNIKLYAYWVEGKDGIWISGLSEEGYTYTGYQIEPSVKIYDCDALLTENKDYTLSFKNNTKGYTITEGEPGFDPKKAPSITVTGKGNYDSKDVKYFKILPQNIGSEDFSADDITLPISTKPQKIKPVLYWNGKALKQKTDYTCAVYKMSDTEFKNPLGLSVTSDEPCIVRFTGTGNFTDTRDINLTFAKDQKLVSSLKIDKVPAAIYTGSPITPEPAVRDGSTVLVRGVHYSVTYASNVNPGTGYVIITGTPENGYSGTKRVPFKINAQKGSKVGAYDISPDKDMANRIQVECASTVDYVKGGAKPAVTVKFTDDNNNIRTLTEGIDYKLSYKNNTSVTTNASVVITGKGSFKGSRNQEFAINAKDISKVSTYAEDKVYQNKANIYATKITLTDSDGKKLSVKKDYQIDKYTYLNDTEVTVGGNKEIREAGTEIGKQDILPVGTVIEVTLSAVNGSGYIGIAKPTYRISKASISSAKVTIPPQTYTGKPIELDPTALTVTVKGQKLTTSEFEIVGYENNTNKGTAKVTIRGKGNYGGYKTQSFKIKAKGFRWWWRN